MNEYHDRKQLKMIVNFLYRILLTLSSTSLLLVIFWVKKRFVIKWGLISPKFCMMPNFASYFLFLIIPISLTLASLFLSRFLDNDDLGMVDQKSVIMDVEQANNAFLPSYLGYFFVALSIDECSTLVFVFSILFVFTFLSQTLYFNPLFLLFRYHFYYLTTINRVKILVITRKILKNPVSIDLPKLKRINDFTFIDRKN